MKKTAKTEVLSPGLASHFTVWAIAKCPVPQASTLSLLLALDSSPFVSGSVFCEWYATGCRSTHVAREKLRCCSGRSSSPPPEQCDGRLLYAGSHAIQSRYTLNVPGKSPAAESWWAVYSQKVGQKQMSSFPESFHHVAKLKCPVTHHRPRRQSARGHGVCDGDPGRLKGSRHPEPLSGLCVSSDAPPNRRCTPICVKVPW